MDIDKLNFSAQKSRMVATLGWTEYEVNLLEAQYKRFLKLHLKYPGHTLVPTLDLDEFWHQHILDTKRYREDCQEIFGKYLDHDPSFGEGSPASEARLHAAFDDTRRLYQQEFGMQLVNVRAKGWCRRWLLRLLSHR